MRVDIVRDRGFWDKIVERSNGTIFHRWGWIKLMEKHSIKKIFRKSCKAKLYPLVIFDGETPIGLFPVFLYKGIVKFVFSPPGGVENLYLGPLIVEYDKLKQSKRESRLLSVIKEVDSFIQSELDPNFIMFSTIPDLIDSRPFKWLGYDVEPRYTYILKLNRGMEEIWKSFHKSLRRGIEKARRSGIIVREGFKDDLEHIYDLLRSRNRIHTSKEFVLEVFKKFKSNVKVFIAEKDGERLSGIVNICYDKKVNFWIGSPKFNYRGVNPNEIVFYESIKWAKENGFKYYEIMGADDFSLFEFKRKFNCDLSMFLTARKYSPRFIKIIEAVYRTIKPRYKNLLI